MNQVQLADFNVNPLLQNKTALVTPECFEWCKEQIITNVAPTFNNLEIKGVFLVIWAMLLLQLYHEIDIRFYRIVAWFEKSDYEVDKAKLERFIFFIRRMAFYCLVVFLVWYLFPIVRYKYTGS